STGSTLTVGSATSGGTQTLHSKSDLTYTSLKTTGITGDAGDIALTSDTGAIAVNGADTLEANGGFSLTAATTIAASSLKADQGAGLIQAAGMINISGVTTTTTLGMTSTGSTLTVGSATSGGTQTLHSKSDLTYTSLKTTGITGDAGDIALTSDTGAIGVTGADTLEANGGFNLAAATTISASSLKAAQGAGLVQAAGAVNVGVVTAATTLGMTSTGRTLTVGSATSGGTQTLHSKGDLTYTSLKTTGITGDTGDIALTSDTGAIAVTGTDTLEANGGYNLAAATTISASSLKAAQGAGLVQAAGAVNVGVVTAATTLGMTSTGSTLTVGSATSGGTQTLHSKSDLTYTSLKTTGITGDAGDIALTSDTGAIGVTGTDTLEANGGFNLAAATTISASSLKAAQGAGLVQAAGAVNVGVVTAASTLGMTSTGRTLTVGSATSGGTQTLHSKGDLTYTSLKTTGITGDTGDIALTSDTGAIAVTGADTLEANGGFSLTAATTISASTLKADQGAGLIQAAGMINISGVTTTTTLGMTSTGSTLTVGSATSGGTQTLHSKNNLTYTNLKTTGITGDTGDIALTSDTGAIGVTGADTLEANGGFNLAAATTISASSLKAAQGAGLVQAAGAVNVGVVTTATTLGMTSTGSTLTVGSATSGGTQTLHSKSDLTYTSLKTTGITGDAGAIALTSDTGAIAVTGADTLEANDGFSLMAATTISASSLKADNGAGLARAAGAINASDITAATTLGITSTGGTLTVGSATSGGNATYMAVGDIGFTLLKSTGGNISATSSAGAVSGTTVAASGDTILSAYTESIGSDITATLGKIGIGATHGRIDWSNLSAATTIVATASGSTLTIGSATSGGSQTLHSKNNLTYTNLKTTGIAGDIALISDTAAIGVTGTDTLEANGGFNLAATTTVSASSLRANNGTGVVQAAGAIHVARATTAGALRMASTGGALTVGSANSGGDGNYTAYGNIGFGNIISSAGSIVATSQSGAINGTELSAPGDVTLDAATTIDIAKIDPANVTIGAGSSVSIGQLIASGTVNLASGSIDVTTLSQDPSASGSFNVNLGGYRGAMGQSASLRIVTPNLLNIGSLNENTASISTTSGNVVIGSGRIMQSLLLTTAQQSIYMTAFFASPQNGYGVQSYLPTGSFYLQQYGLETTTNSLVVQFASGAKVRQDMNGRMILGFSLAGNVGQVIGSVGSANEDSNDASAPTWNPDPSVYATSGDAPMNSSGYVPAVNWTAKQPLAIKFSSGTPTLQ
ncbi:hypothetical protein ABID16_002353, partial [Rhizobium aquaticum]